MRLQTLGHASLLLADDVGRPLLLTDPWLTGSVYWRSWWLQNYPDEGLLRTLTGVRHVYFTHSHPDHFHPPSIRKLGSAPEYLLPSFPENPMLAYLRENHLRARALPAFEWADLGDGLRVASVPLWNDDSILLMETPTALIFNLNDAKPPPRMRRQLAALRKSAGKRCVVLSSYSPASLVNSFLRNRERVSLRDKESYLRYILRLCADLGATDFMPFASQAIFLRSDSTWANAFKVTYDDLRRAWQGSTRLLPPYSTLDLVSGAASNVETTAYNGATAARAESAAKQQALDEVTVLDESDFAKLRAKLAQVRWLLRLTAPKIGFHVGNQKFSYLAWSEKIEPGTDSRCAFILEVPARPFQEAVSIGHIGDLGITMFTIVHLRKGASARLVYAFFVILTLGDYNYLRSAPGLSRWSLHALRLTFSSRLLPPPPTAAP